MILVIGSINIDYVTNVNDFPAPGETISATGFTTSFGGKGANQAVACGKLGAEVKMFGCIGQDSEGRKYVEKMKEANIDTSLIETVEGKTGMAFINVDKAGENNIIIVPAANNKMKPSHIEELRETIKTAKIVISQLEVPMDVVKTISKICKEEGTEFILNPAPFDSTVVDTELLQCVDYLVPNETEVLGFYNDATGYEDAANRLLEAGVKNVVVTLGEKGAMHFTKGTKQHYPANKVTPVDTVAAGDTFIGGFATMLSEGKSISEAITFGGKAASITIQRTGAYEAIPFRNEI